MLIPNLFQKYGIRGTRCPGVLHLGANVGQEMNIYAAAGIPRVIWVEADARLFHRLLQNISPFPGHVAVLACVSDRDGDRVQFNVANNGGQSSSFLQFGTHAQSHPTVKFVEQVELVTERVDTALKKRNIQIGGAGWFLNVDLQGAELLALRGMGELLHHFDHAYVEVNERELYVGCPLVQDIDEHLAAYGFRGVEVKMEKPGWGDKYYHRRG